MLFALSFSLSLPKYESLKIMTSSVLLFLLVLSEFILQSELWRPPIVATLITHRQTGLFFFCLFFKNKRCFAVAALDSIGIKWCDTHSVCHLNDKEEKHVSEKNCLSRGRKLVIGVASKKGLSFRWSVGRQGENGKGRCSLVAHHSFFLPSSA